jgi:hypothetical protein
MEIFLVIGLVTNSFLSNMEVAVYFLGLFMLSRIFTSKKMLS